MLNNKVTFVKQVWKDTEEKDINALEWETFNSLFSVQDRSSGEKDYRRPN